MLPVVLVDELLRLHGIGVKLAESVFSSGDGVYTPFRLRFVILGGAVMRPTRFNAPDLPFVI